MSPYAADDAGAGPASPGSVDLIVSLMRHVGRLADRVGFERSFKVTAGSLLQDRMLFGIERAGTDAAWDAALDQACLALGMPAASLDEFQRALGPANHVYFGAERDGARVTLKAYLEFRDAVERQLAEGRAPPGGCPLYLGYKWEPADPVRRAPTRYVWHPDLGAGEILARVKQQVAPAPSPALRRLVATVAGRALDTVAPREFRFLEVREEGNPRSSFDINVYRAGIRIRDLQAPLTDTLGQCAIPATASEALLARIGAERVGHLAAGVDRSGREFLTLYHGGSVIDGVRLRQASAAHRAAG